MKRLLLVGAGHAHLGVLADLARAPLPGVEVSLVTPYPRQIYSGMLPGWIAGHYRLDDCAIAVAPVAARAQAHCFLGQVVALDLDQRRATTAHGEVHEFDWVSLDTGAVPQPDLTQGAAYVGAALRPIETFIQAWGCVAQPFPHRALTVVGGGAAGVELVLAMAWRLAQQKISPTLQLIAGQRGVLAEFPQGVRRRVLRHLSHARVHVIQDDVVALEGCEGDTLRLASAQRLYAGWTVMATGTAAAPWPRAAGLTVDERGFIQTTSTLQSASHPFVFAAGDCASMRGQRRARSGVYAVRAGPPLAHNLRRIVAGKPLRAYVPQQRALYLLSTGGRHAIASWGAWSLEGDWVWRWNDRIDHQFVGRYRYDTA